MVTVSATASIAAMPTIAFQRNEGPFAGPRIQSPPACGRPPRSRARIESQSLSTAT